MNMLRRLSWESNGEDTTMTFSHFAIARHMAKRTSLWNSILGMEGTRFKNDSTCRKSGHNLKKRR